MLMLLCDLHKSKGDYQQIFFWIVLLNACYQTGFWKLKPFFYRGSAEEDLKHLTASHSCSVVRWYGSRYFRTTGKLHDILCWLCYRPMIYRFPGSFPNASFMCIFCLAARLAPQTRKPTPQPRPWTCLCFTALSPPSPPWLSPSLKQRTVQKALSSLTSWQRVREQREGLKGSKAEAIPETHMQSSLQKWNF